MAIVCGIHKALAHREVDGDDEEAAVVTATYAEAASTSRIQQQSSDDEAPASSPNSLSAVVTTELGRFSVHAHTAVAADERSALERLIRYGLRPPLAQKRLSLTDAGNVRYRLRKPTYDGRTDVVLQPTAFVKRLAAFVPPKGQHVIRYFGLLAPRAGHRAAVLARGGDAAAGDTVGERKKSESADKAPSTSPYRKACCFDLVRVSISSSATRTMLALERPTTDRLAGADAPHHKGQGI